MGTGSKWAKTTESFTERKKTIITTGAGIKW